MYKIFAKNILKVAAALVIIFLLGWLKEKNNIPNIIIKLIPSLAFLFGSFVVVETTKGLYRLRNKMFLDSDNVITGLNNIFQVLVFFAFIMLLLNYFNIGLVEFFTAISIVAAAIAIVSKDYLIAIISGFVISFTKLVNIGDYVKLGDHKGKIINLDLTKIYLQNDQGELIVINNDKAYFGDVINYSQSNQRRVKINFEIHPKDLKSIENFEKELRTQLQEYKDSIIEETISLKIEELKTKKIIFSLLYTITKLEPMVEKTIRRETTRKILNYVQQNLPKDI